MRTKQKLCGSDLRHSLRGLTATEKKLLSSVTLMSSPSTPYVTLVFTWTVLLDVHVHIAKSVQVGFFQLRRLRRVRRLLGQDVTASLVAALVFSRLDYCNALLAGLPDSSLAPYQRVITAAVRLVNGPVSYTHLTLPTIYSV